MLSMHLAEEFEIKTLGKLVSQNLSFHFKKGTFISQQKYIIDTLHETCKTTCQPTNTPVDPSINLGSDKEDIAIDKEMY